MASVGLTYTLNGDSYIVTGIGTCTDTDLVIPSVYEGKAVTSIKSYAFLECTTLTSVTIPNSMTSIAAQAFRYCSGLTSVTLPSSVTSIGTQAFTGCSNIATIIYEGTLSQWLSISGLLNLMSSGTTTKSLSIGGSSMMGALIIPSSITSIQSYAFCECTGLTSVTIPDSVTSIGSEAFYGCSGLTSVTIGNGVTSIGSGAFSGCSDLTSLTVEAGNVNYHNTGNCLIKTNSKTLIQGFNNSVIPNDGSVTSIGNGAFDGCTGLTSVTIPDSVTSIGYRAFSGCSGLTSIIIGNGVTSIDGFAFSNCSGLTSIEIPSSVMMISNYAFTGCSGLVSMTIPFVGGSQTTSSDTYQRPFGYIFGGSSYTGGTEVTQTYYGSSTSSTTTSTYYIPSSLRSVTVTGGNILRGAFMNCSMLTSIIIPNGVTSIGNSAFNGCSGLTSITIPSSMTTISISAFYGCSNLSTITHEGTLAQWCGISGLGNLMQYGTSNKSLYVDGSLVTGALTIPSGVTSIAAFAFYKRTGLTSVMIPEGVTNIGIYAFSYCTGLTTITIPSGITSFGSYAFSFCTGLTSVTIESGVTDIGSNAFYGCNSLTSVTIENGVTSIGPSAFFNCSSLTSIIIPDSVTNIGGTAFSGCSALTSITIPFVGSTAGKTATDTYQYPFGYIFGTFSYEGGTAVTQYYYGSSTSSTTNTTYYIPTSLRSVTVTGGDILYGAFYGCSMLTSITIPNSVTSIGINAFRDCSGLTSMTIPDSVTSIGNSAFSDCRGLTSIMIPDSVTSIGMSAFSRCTGLTSIAIPDSVTIIGTSAFRNCSGLTSITIPSSVTSIGGSIFSGCSGLTSIAIPFVGDSIKTAIDSYQYPFGYIFGTTSYTDGTAVEQYYYGSSTSSTTSSTYYIPTSLRSVTVTRGNILYGAFSNCRNITNIILSSAVTSIESCAFLNCSGLTSIVIPNNVQSIGEGAFNGCAGLTSMTLPFVGNSRKTATDDYQYPFGYIFGSDTYTGGQVVSQQFYTTYPMRDIVDYCIPTALTEVIITGGNILCGAFQNCTQLTSITVPFTIEDIEKQAFKNCSGLTSFTIPSGVCTIWENAFQGCTSLTEVDFQYATTLSQIKTFAFAGCTALSSITIPSSVTTLSSGAFSGCSALTTVRISDNSALQLIDSGAFSENTALTFITLPNSLSSIGIDVFRNSSNLTKIYYYGSQTNWNNIAKDANWNRNTNPNLEVIYQSIGLDYELQQDSTYAVSGIGTCQDTALTIPMEHLGIPVTLIKTNAFLRNQNITSVTILDNLTTIGARAFQKCSQLEVVNIGDNVSIIDYYAFNYVNIHDLFIPDSVVTISSSAFESNYHLYKVRLGSRLTTIDNSAFGDCFRLVEVVNNSTLPISKNTANGSVGYYSKKIWSNDETYVTKLSNDNNFILYKEDNTKYSLVDYIGNIPHPSLNTLQLSNINQYGFFKNTTITQLEIPEGVTLEQRVFSGCSSLQSLSLSDQTILPQYLCYGCTALTSITIPATVTTISAGAFQSCENLATVNFAANSNLSLIQTMAFGDCYSLTSIELPDTVQTLGARIFAKCTNLSSLEAPHLPNNGTTINSFGAFFDTNYQSGQVDKYYTVSQQYSAQGTGTSRTYYIPKGLKTVIINGGNMPQDAFHGCYEITRLVLKENVTYPHGILKGCYGLTSLVLSSVAQNPLGYIFGGSSYANATTVTQRGAIYYIPTSLSSVEVLTGNISDEAFNGCTNLTSISLPQNTTSIGERAFKNCGNQNISPLNIPQTITNIASNAFNQFYGSIQWSGTPTIQAIGEQAFAGYKGSSITIPASVTTIANQAFKDCDSFTEFAIPNTVNNIGINILKGCNSLETLSLPRMSNASTSYILANLFETIPSSLKTVSVAHNSIPANAFQNCNNLTTINLPTDGTTTSIGANAFDGATGLTSINIPESVTAIGADAFNNCTCTINWGNNPTITTLGSQALRGYKKSSFNFPSSVTQLGDHVFENCTGFTNFTVPNHINNIGSGAFHDCSNLQSLTLPFVGSSRTSTGAESLFGYIFGTVQTRGGNGTTQYYKVPTRSGTENLESITYAVPDSLTTVVITDQSIIPERAFQNCDHIESVTLYNDIIEIGDYAFYNCYNEDDATGLSSITMSNTVIIGDHAFENCQLLNNIIDINNPTAAMGYVFNNNIGDYAFTNTQLTSVALGANVVLGQYAFSNCSLLDSIDLPSTLEEVSIGAFSDCDSLTEVRINEGTKIVNSLAFGNCNALNTVYLPKTLIRIGDYAFEEFNGTIWYNSTPHDWGIVQKNNFILGSEARLYAIAPSTIRKDFIGDYRGFTFGKANDGVYNDNCHSSYYGILRTSSSNRYEDKLNGTLKENTQNRTNADGTIYFGTNVTQRQFTINFAFDSMTEPQLLSMKKWLNPKEIKDLIFDEDNPLYSSDELNDSNYILIYGTPSNRIQKIWKAKVTGQTNIKQLCFTEDSQRIYKGEGSVQFTCYFPYALGKQESAESLDDNYVYIDAKGDVPTELVIDLQNLSGEEIKQGDKIAIQEGNNTIFECVFETDVAASPNWINYLRWDTKTGLVKTGKNIVVSGTPTVSWSIIPTSGNTLGLMPEGGHYIGYYYKKQSGDNNYVIDEDLSKKIKLSYYPRYI